MKKNPLSWLLTQLMFAGSLSASISLPAQAGDLYQRYWQQVAPQFSQHFGRYQFRPTAADVDSVSRYRQSYGARHFSRSVTAVNRYAPVIRPVYGQPMKQMQTPAFTRQFAWSPAPNTVYRRGGSYHHYASEQNNSFETDQVDVPRYRTAPVSTQGLRFRSAERSAPFVSFSERVRQSMPQSMHQADNFSTAVSQPAVTVKPAIPVAQQVSMPVVARPVMQPPVFSQPMMPMLRPQSAEHYQPAPQHMHQPMQAMQPAMPMMPMPQPAMQPVEPPVKIFMSSQPLPSADGYQFRPDERFIAPSEQGRPVEVKPFKPSDPVRVSPTEVENVQLARAQFVPAADSPWNNYTFRPTDIVLQR